MRPVDFEVLCDIASGKLTELHPLVQNRYKVLYLVIEALVGKDLVMADFYTVCWKNSYAIEYSTNSTMSTNSIPVTGGFSLFVRDGFGLDPAFSVFVLNCVRDIKLTEKGRAVLAVYQLERMAPEGET